MSESELEFEVPGICNEEMAENDDWIIQVHDKVHKEEVALMVEAQKWKRRSIYKLPPSVTDLNKNAYTPQVVSFGPYHCKDENLKPMEEHKDRALVNFLKRSILVDVKPYYESLLAIVNDLMDAYQPLDLELQQNPNAFLKLMIRDGCFMLEIFRAAKENFEGYDANDPVFGPHGRLYVIPHLKRDMLMLENQLPMKVLQKLHQVQNGLATDQEANQLVFEFLFPSNIGNLAPSDSLHILDMYRKCMLKFPGETSQKNVKSMIPTGGDDIIRSAIELEEAGIKIKKSSTRSLRDISFKDKELRLPMIVVDDAIKPLFLNLIAFERFHVGAGNEVTAYVYFMDNIIDDARDIALLHSRDIIQNGIGSDKAAAKLFNSLSRDVTLDQNSYLGGVYRSVKAHCKKKCPKFQANLYHEYFTSPWACIYLFAAIFLFVLTTVQTVFTVYGVYK